MNPRRAWNLMPVVAAPLGAAWIGHRRDTYRRRSAPLTPDALDRLRGFFGPALLARVEVARVAHIPNPIAGLLHRFGPGGLLDLTTVRGMAFIDTIIIAGVGAHRSEDETSLLFHELVHIVQYQFLGTPGFVRAYLNGWLGAGRSYINNPMEAMAFELQDRFDAAGDVFDVHQEVRRRLSMII